MKDLSLKPYAYGVLSIIKNWIHDLQKWERTLDFWAFLFLL